ncbi:arginyl-tRNA-protein transferase [Tepidicaulis marinus]|uniref:Aspartate/glutamate leucyltransferase n=1 Tax=Tepidicaulis marinus TaxID=1333998 RepID=A0A081B7X3_9HYPH|nr:arginyltransferase [Tepidicaulis marinus]GAK44141.1 arginyl-tRNA-protein transferase [Tepidicaulis marinus]
MTRHDQTQFPQFYITAPSPCPYLKGRYEKKVFTHLVGEQAGSLNNMLSQAGFRRSQGIAYRPACDGCDACISVRIRVNEFSPSRNMRRILNANQNLVRTRKPARATEEQFSLLRSYLDARHQQGGMADMTALDFVSMVEDTAVDTNIIEYRPRAADADNRLIATALTDRLEDGLSMVYSFFDPDLSARSLGTYLILDHIALARELGLPYVYLGYWIEGSAKMAYKARFKPLEALTREGWRLMD